MQAWLPILKLIAVQPYIVIFVMWRSPWRWTALCAVIVRIAPRFSRYEPLRHPTGLMLGMVSRLDRENRWTIVEHRGEATPKWFVASAFTRETRLRMRSAMICVTT